MAGEINDYLKLTTQLMPAEMMGGTPGTYVTVKFGSKYSVSGGAQVTQKIFDPTYLYGIKSAKINKDISVLSQLQTIELTAYNVSLIYYRPLVIQMQVNVLKSTLKASEQSLKSIELKHKNGMAKKIEVDKVRVSYNNTKSQLTQAELSHLQSLNMLKYHMGMPVDSSMVLADTTLNASKYLSANDTVRKFQMENVIDYQLKNANILSMMVDGKAKTAAFMPVLSFYGNYNYNAMQQEFNFFDADNDWYPSSVIGLKLAIPIFDGFQRNSRAAQAQLNIKVAKENLVHTEQSIKVDISNYENQYINALDNINREKENLDLAESVFENTQLEYQQGTSSTLDLIQSESAYMVAQNTYFNKLLDLYIARLELEKTKGNLMKFINS